MLRIMEECNCTCQILGTPRKTSFQNTIQFLVYFSGNEH